VRVLLLGGGGREHALGWKLAQSPQLTRLISAPGNPGLDQLGETLPDVDPTDGAAVLGVARAHDIDLVVVGPEAPLAAGVVDVLTDAGFEAWGPTADAAALESSKTFAKRVMDRAGVRTAAWASFERSDAALRYLDECASPFVVKADGLASGKGVLVTSDRAEAKDWVRRCLAGDFGRKRVVIEDYLEGAELSVFAICSGEEAIPLEPARDFKRLLDGNQGPNTGGMGSYSPVAGLPAGIVEYAIDRVIKPVLKTMAGDGHPYTGFLYAGLVLTREEPTVLEFNCRLGDPETQVVLPRLRNDLLMLIVAGIEGRLGEVTLDWSPDAYLNVVLAAPGYPQAPVVGGPIDLGNVPEGTLLFHAGTKRTDQGLCASGGRVLNVVGRGADLPAARSMAYEAVAAISYPGAQYRSDI
jgi:phosphoribosylamine--glycine ligase